jgi:hypothetical protein
METLYMETSSLRTLKIMPLTKLYIREFGFRVSVQHGEMRGCKRNLLRVTGKLEEKLQLCGDLSKYSGNSSRHLFISK